MIETAKASNTKRMNIRDYFKFCVNVKNWYKICEYLQMGGANFLGSALICIIQEFLGMSIKPAYNKLFLQVTSNQTFFKIDFQPGMDLPPVLPVTCPFFVISIVARYSIFNRLSSVGKTVLLFVIFRSYRLNPSIAFVV